MWKQLAINYAWLSVDFKENAGHFLLPLHIHFISLLQKFSICDILAYFVKLSEVKNSFGIRESVNFILFIVDVACSFIVLKQKTLKSF